MASLNSILLVVLLSKYKHNYIHFEGADDLKGKFLQHCGEPGKKVVESDILMNLFILIKQAKHEMKNGDPNVSLKTNIFI